MNFKSFQIIFIVTLFLIVFLNNVNLLCNQEECLGKMRNGDIFAIEVNEIVVVKNIWKESSLKDWNIKVNVLKLEKKEALVEIVSSTFLGEDFTETKFMKLGEVISIIQAEEVATKLKLEKIVKNNAIFSLKIEVAPPAPELSESFDVAKTLKQP